MKIIAGRYGGRILVQPKTPATRPMSDKVREALFNIIGPVSGLKVLDAYAGSGAVGLEALSRGAAEVTLIEQARAALQSIKTNQTVLQIGSELIVIGSSVERAIPKLEGSEFDVIVADPPYGQIEAMVLDQLGQLLASSGTLIASHSSRIPAPTLESMERLDTRLYGDSALSFYKGSGLAVRS